ncbi:MAG: hypothetical protein GWO16_11750 [Gammaproteobacteria bacterium]|nr:hypothetical protein [Gammaproteobacteria bacterium]NIR98602.1 hypothetical protein [Gammaproteobacteria bacterium]NIT64325.1 hypothetical protein [Gammaproteobacteria bacterium]NIV21249.1 hypothetical protein [Gammaproteobacteria bacterium]NIX10953.1 hypothetical protein [Gammaproteobacteria bacterium]
MTGLARMVLVWTLAAVAAPVQAHHVLGRPSYGLSEDRNTPPSMQVETQIGEYFVTFMVFPATPEPGEPGRLNLHAARADDGKSLTSPVTFTVRDGGWLTSDEEEVLGVQAPVDSVYRQGFEFSEPGDYVVSAAFEAGGEPYRVDFPLRIGSPVPVGPIGLSVTAVALVLVAVNVLQRRRLQRLQTRRHRAGT